MWSDSRLTRLQLAAAAIHDVALRKIDLSLVKELLSVGLRLVNALGLSDGRGQATAAAGRGIAVPRPLPIDVHKLADPVCVTFADAQGAGRSIAKLKAPSRVVAETDHVGNVRWLGRRCGLLLAGRGGAVLSERTVLGKYRQRRAKQRDGETGTQKSKRHKMPSGNI